MHESLSEISAPKFNIGQIVEGCIKVRIDFGRSPVQPFGFRQVICGQCMIARIVDVIDGRLTSKQSNQTDYSRCNMLYNGLTSLDASLSPQPALAESFNTQDAKTWVFTLRKGVVFHDGKALSPADVVFSLMRHKDPATASKAKVLAEQIDTVRASGPNEGGTASRPGCRRATGGRC